MFLKLFILWRKMLERFRSKPSFHDQPDHIPLSLRLQHRIGKIEQVRPVKDGQWPLRMRLAHFIGRFRLSDGNIERLMMANADFKNRTGLTQLTARFSNQLALIGSLIAVMLSLLFFHHFQSHGLDVESMDCAQLGRNISAGHGFTTDFIRPIALSLSPGGTPAPEVTRPPLYPFLLGWIFSATGPKDSVVIAVSICLYLLTATALFILAMRLTEDLATAVLSCVVFGLCSPVLSLADAGSPLILPMALVTALLVVLTPRDVEAPLSDRQAAIEGCMIGLLTGLCYLADYFCIIYVLPLLLLWGRGPTRWNRNSFLFFAGTALLVTCPWLIRNFRLTGNPLYSLQWLEIGMQIPEAPGLSLYRDLEKSKLGSLWTLLPGLGSMSHKLMQGLASFYDQIPLMPNLYLFPLILVAFWRRDPFPSRQRSKSSLLLSLGVYILLLSLLGRTSFVQLTPFVPVLAILGVIAFQWMSSRWVVEWVQSRIDNANDRPIGLGATGFIRTLFLVVFLTVLTFPLVWQSTHAPQGKRDIAAMTTELKGTLPAKGVVVTDVPWAVAWYADRTALWLPPKVSELSDLEKQQPVGGVYLSPAITTYATEEQLGEWLQVYRQGSELPGYVRTADNSLRSFTYQKMATLEEAKAMAAKHPESAVDLADLGRAQLMAGHPDEAIAPLKAALSRQPKMADALDKLGRAYLELKQFPLARECYLKVLAIEPRQLDALLNTGETWRLSKHTPEAIQAYEKVLGDYPNNVIAINNLAVMYSETGQNLDRALEMAKRAVQSSPNSGEMLDTLGWVCYQAGRYQEAAHYLSYALNALPHEPSILYHFGKALMAIHRPQDAAAAFRQSLSNNIPLELRADAEESLSKAQ